MLSSTFSKYSEVDVSAARSGGGSAGERPELFISLSGENWRVNGEPADFSNIAALLERYQSGTSTKAILRVTEEASSQNLIDAIEILNQKEITVTLVR